MIEEQIDPNRPFPIMRDHLDASERLLIPKSIPWYILAPHETQARSNHGQTLKRLAERGGLAFEEAYDILRSRRWNTKPHATPEQFVALVKERTIP